MQLLKMENEHETEEMITGCDGEPRCNHILITVTCIVLILLLFLTAFGNIVTFM